MGASEGPRRKVQAGSRVRMNVSTPRKERKNVDSPAGGEKMEC